MSDPAGRSLPPAEGIAWRHAEMRSAALDRLDPELARRAAQLDAAALAVIRDRNDRADVAIDMGYASQAQTAYRHELVKHPEVAKFVEQTFEQHRREVWDKEVRKARELAALGRFPTDERARDALNLDREYEAMNVASSYALKNIRDRQQREAFLESVRVKVFDNPDALPKTPATRQREAEQERVKQERDRGQPDRER